MIENAAYNNQGEDHLIKKYIAELLLQSPDIDTLLLACTQYLLILKKIRKFTPSHINIISQGEIVAESFKNYLHRHPEIEIRCTKNSRVDFLQQVHFMISTDIAGIFLVPI